MQVAVTRRATKYELEVSLSLPEFKHVFGREPSKMEEPSVAFRGNAIEGIEIVPSVRNKQSRLVKILIQTPRQPWAARLWLDPRQMGVLAHYHNPQEIEPTLNGQGKIIVPPLHGGWLAPDAAEAARANPLPKASAETPTEPVVYRAPPVEAETPAGAEAGAAVEAAVEVAQPDATAPTADTKGGVVAERTPWQPAAVAEPAAGSSAEEMRQFREKLFARPPAPPPALKPIAGSIDEIKQNRERDAFEQVRRMVGLLNHKIRDREAGELGLRVDRMRRTLPPLREGKPGRVIEYDQLVILRIYKPGVLDD